MLGTLLRTTRHGLHLSLAEAAAHIGISQQYLGRLENGRQSPSLKLLCRLRRVYKLPDPLLDTVDPEADHDPACAVCP